MMAEILGACMDGREALVRAGRVILYIGALAAGLVMVLFLGWLLFALSLSFSGNPHFLAFMFIATFGSTLGLGLVVGVRYIRGKDLSRLSKVLLFTGGAVLSCCLILRHL